MAKADRIFAKRRLEPSQLREVAEIRLADAEYLAESGKQARANGAMYLPGFAVECLLKAILLDRHRNLRMPVDPATLSTSDREVYYLLYGHDLAAMLIFLPDVRVRLEAIKTAGGRSAWPAFRELCARWTIYARYSPVRATLTDAAQFVGTVREVKQWLREL